MKTKEFEAHRISSKLNDVVAYIESLMCDRSKCIDSRLTDDELFEIQKHIIKLHMDIHDHLNFKDE